MSAGPRATRRRSKRMTDVTLLRERRRVGQIVTAYADVARPLMRQWLSPNSCIAATRITMNILNVFGIDARPLPVVATVHNPAWLALGRKLKRQPTVDEQKADPGNAWSVGLGFNDPESRDSYPVDPNNWAGHLVALTLNDALLIDGAIDQASRPQYDMPIPPIVLVQETTARFLDGSGSVVGETPDGVIISYHRNLTPDLYEHAPDWRVTKHGLIELAIMRAMKAQGVTP